MHNIALCAPPGDRAALEMLATRLDTFDGLVEWGVGCPSTPPELVLYLFSDPETLRDAMRLRARLDSNAFELFINIGEPLTRRPAQLLLCQTSPGSLRQTLESIAAVCIHGTYGRGILPFAAHALREMFGAEGWVETQHYSIDDFFKAVAQTSPLSHEQPGSIRRPIHAFCAMSHAPTKRHKPNFGNVITAFGTLFGHPVDAHFAFTFRAKEARIDTLAVFAEAPISTAAPSPQMADGANLLEKELTAVL
jgi:hypothetical protein